MKAILQLQKKPMFFLMQISALASLLTIVPLVAANPGEPSVAGAKPPKLSRFYQVPVSLAEFRQRSGKEGYLSDQTVDFPTLGLSALLSKDLTTVYGIHIGHNRSSVDLFPRKQNLFADQLRHFETCDDILDYLGAADTATVSKAEHQYQWQLSQAVPKIEFRLNCLDPNYHRVGHDEPLVIQTITVSATTMIDQ